MNETPAGRPLTIPAAIRDAMVEHCVKGAPLECCGILGGVAPLVSSIHPLRNAEASETRYNADGRDLILAWKEIRARGGDLLAIYHSHPSSVAIPSKADVRHNYHGDVPHIIVSLEGPEPVVRVWRIGPTDYVEVPWEVVPRGP